MEGAVVDRPRQLRVLVAGKARAPLHGALLLERRHHGLYAAEVEYGSSVGERAEERAPGEFAGKEAVRRVLPSGWPPSGWGLADHGFEVAHRPGRIDLLKRGPDEAGCVGQQIEEFVELTLPRSTLVERSPARTARRGEYRSWWTQLAQAARSGQ
jgi:hypothetical protein